MLNAKINVRHIDIYDKNSKKRFACDLKLYRF